MIAIKNIKMPKECYRCPLLDGEYGTCNIIGETKVDMTEERASNCPLVEIQEPRTGHWIRFKNNENGYYHIKCSECGQYWSVDGHAKTFKYCFNCGIKMIGSEKKC